MLNQFARTLINYDLLIAPSSKEVRSIPPLSDVLELLDSYQKTNPTVWRYERSSRALRLAQMRIDYHKGYAVLLLTHSDLNGADPGFSNIDTGTTRLERKRAGEGLAASAHLVLSLNSSEPTRSVYRAVLEDIPGFGKTVIEPYITWLLKECSNYSFRDSSGRDKRFRPVPSLITHASETLRSALVSGAKIHELELISYKQNKTFDEDGVLKVESKSMILKVSTPQDETSMSQILNFVTRKAKSEGYTEVRLRMKQPSVVSRSDRQRTVLYGTGREDATEVVFGKIEEIRLDEPHDQCRDTISAEIELKMAQFLGSSVIENVRN